MEDLELLRRWREGDEDAGGRLLKRHFVAITRFFERRVDASQLDELVQLTFLGCVRAKDNIPEGVRFKAYLLGIARNQLLMFIRRKKARAAPVPMDDQLAAGSSLLPTRLVAKREEAKVVIRALAELPPDLQQVVELYYWEELSVKEIGAVLDRPPGTIKTWLFRARNLIKSWIERSDIPPNLAASTVTFIEGS